MSFFAVVEAILRVLNLWDAFLAYTDKVRAAKTEENNQSRDKALGDAQNAKTPDDAYKAQTGVVSSEP
jgi:hypothetical protein